MIQKVRGKMKVIVEDHSYEEYTRNMGVYSVYLRVSSLLIILLVGSLILLSWLFQEVQFEYLIYSMIVLCLIVTIFDERKRLEIEYLRYAEKSWRTSDRRELLPRVVHMVDDSNFKSLMFFGRSVSVRSDVIINNGIIEYYVPLEGGIAKRNTLPVSAVICQSGRDDRSFFVRETQRFSDERFELLAQQVGVPFQRSRIIIESNYIQWKG